MLQIKIIYIYLNMSHQIDHVFCNPVENSFCGHPIPLGNSYPLVPQSPRDFHWRSLWGGGGGLGGYGLFSGITQCLSTGSHPFSSLSSRFLHPFPKERACYPTCYPWGLRKNATAFWLNIILLQRDLLIKKWIIFSEQNRIRPSSIAFDFVRLVR